MKNFWKTNHFLLLLLILALAAALRFYGLNWDQGHHLHPDERFLTMVSTSLEWPKNITEYFSTATSPLNPANKNFPFFVYGTFPLFLVKAIAQLLNFGDYDHITLVGRAVSAVFDLGTIIIIFLIGKKVFSPRVGILGSFFYAVSVLPIQLSHFYTVDTFTAFFMTVSVYLLILYLHTPSTLPILLSGVGFGLGLASKVNALLMLPVILTVVLITSVKRGPKVLPLWILFFLLSFITFRSLQPYAFSATSIFDLSLTPFLKSLSELSVQASPKSAFPPSVQWFNTTPFLYPLRDIALWGLGLPLGITALISAVVLTVKTGKVLIQSRFRLSELSLPQITVILLLTLTGTIFLYQGFQFAKAMRYFLPLYPPLVILTAYFLTQLKSPKLLKYLKLPFFLLILIWPLSFMTIYTLPHTRVRASEWIYQNIPPGSKISYEYWDDPLPLNLPQRPSAIYQGIQFPLYDPDVPQKWDQMTQKLAETDYIILSSNRLYGSITRVPERYPQTGQFYQALFDGSLGFKRVVEFTSRPTLPLPFLRICLKPPGASYGIIARIESCPDSGLSIVDDYADETFTVYDHPKVVIFKKR